MAVLRVIFVHGISDVSMNFDYTGGFSDRLVARLKQLKVIPERAGKPEIDKIITFERVDYSEIGKAEEDRLLAAYEKEKRSLYNMADKLLDQFAFFDQARRFFISSVSDALLYESDYWRDKVRQALLDKINPYVKSHDPVSVVGHSLGSVVSFDTLYYNSRHNPDWLAANFKPTNLFTIGAPVACFSLELDDQTGQQKPRYLPADQTPPELDPANTNPDLHFIRDEGVWLNMLDAQDLIAYPLEEIFKDKFRVKDILVQNGTNPVKAHTDYWKNDEVAHRVAERLALDYKMANS